MADNKINNYIEMYLHRGKFFEGLVDAPVQYKAYHPMRYVQGYLGSCWTPPSGNYLLCNTLAATRATANKTTTKI
jgi:hypothetical protein